MPLSQADRFETILAEATQNWDIQTLNAFLQRDFDESSSLQCSQQFLSKLDKFICECLDQSNSQAATLGFTVIYKCGKNLKLPGGQGLSALIAQGLVKKMLQWFEKCRQLWILGGHLRDESLLNLAEDFFDALMEVHESGNSGAVKVTESFLCAMGHMAVDPRIHILIQKEAIRKFNLILDKSPMELKKDRKILQSQEAADVMTKLASRILDGWDYDFQTALMEALCRMATSEQRKQLADRWFIMEHVSTAFVKIRDSEFETDCRKFLNMVNGMKGDKRSVFSYPCLEVYLGNTELFMPADEKLEEYWIDFNIGSHSISFYFSLPDEEAQEGQWETICVNENEVKSYTVKKEGKRKVLKLDLSDVVVVGSVEGSILTIYFSSALEILPVVQRVYGHQKNTGFVGKTGTSVVKTTVKVIMDENNATSQVVPESQVSLGESEKKAASYSIPAATAPIQMKTPAKMRMSESTTYISSSGGGSARSISAVLPAAKCKGKPSLEMVCSVGRPGQNYMGEFRTTAKSSLSTTPITARRKSVTEQSITLRTNETDKHKKNIPLTKARNMVLSGSEDELPMDSTFVPDSQPTTDRNISSNWHKCSASEMLMMPTQKICSLPRSASPPSSTQKQVCPSSAQQTSAPSSGPVNPKQLHIELTQRLQKVLNKRNQMASPKNIQGQKMSENSQDPKTKSSVGQIGSQMCGSKEVKLQRDSKAKAKDKIKSQMMEGAVVVKTPGKAAEEKMALAVKSTPLSSKEKMDAEVTGKMVKHISSHYEVNSLTKIKRMGNKISQCLIPPLIDRPFFNMKWHTSMGNVTSSLKTNNKTKNSSTKQSKDVFAFSVDTPQSFGKSNALTSTTCIRVTDEDSTLPSTKKKEQPPPKAKRYVKKHLFSDTDTDRGTTDVSWVRESSRKPKPKVIKYSRQAPAKPRAVPALPSCDLPAPSPVPVKGNMKSSTDVAKQPQKKVKAAPVVSKPPAAGRRPLRAVANTPKNYKEMDSDGSQSESELFQVGNYEKTHEIQERNKINKQSLKSYVEPESNNSSQSESEIEQPDISEYYKDELTKQGKKLTTRSEQVANKRLDYNNHTDLKKPPEKQQRPVNVLQGSAQKPKKPTKKNAVAVKEQTATLKESWAACQVVLSPPPFFIERMRSVERAGPSLNLTCSPVLSLQTTPLTISPNPFGPDPITPVMLLPKSRSTATSAGDFKTTSFDSAGKKQGTSRIQSIKSVHSLASVTPTGHTKTCGAMKPSAVESPVQQDLSSPPQSPLSLSRPLMTSTLVNQDKPALPSLPQSPVSEVRSSQGSDQSLSKISSVSQVSQVSLGCLSTKSSVTSKTKDKASATLSVALSAEKTPQMDESLKSAEDLESGPSRKRHISYSSSSNSDEEEKEQIKKSKMRTQHSPQMKPRKLFKSATKTHDKAKSWQDQSTIGESKKASRPKIIKKSVEENVSAKRKRSKKYITEDTVTEVSAEGSVSQVLSSSHTMISGHWDADVEDADIDDDFDGSGINPRDMCREFSCKLQKKFKSRFKMVEVYNKQSLKTVQQHISTINSQVGEHRTQRSEKVQRVLLEEIHKLEQDDTVLKNMENDLTMYWNKQTVAFRSLQKQEKRRNEVLKKTLQNSLCHSLEYEERVFTSQMCLIRKDMKSAQDRLLSEIQEGEIQSLKRGLHALFFPDPTRF